MNDGNKHEMKVQLSLFVMLACIGAVAAPVEVSVLVGSSARVWTNAARRVVYDFGRDAFGWAEARNAAGKHQWHGDMFDKQFCGPMLFSLNLRKDKTAQERKSP